MSGGVRGRCVICTSFFVGCDISALPCGHTFHYGCILQWFEQCESRKTCPNCRAKVSERAIVKQLYFDVGDATQAPPNVTTNEEKIEELSLNLEKLRREHFAVKERLEQVNVEKAALEKKLETERAKTKMRIPQLEERAKQLEMLLEDQNDLQRKLDEARARLRTSDFYKKLMGGEDAEQLIDRYITLKGDPDAGKFLNLVRQQYMDTRQRLEAVSATARRDEKRVRVLEAKVVELKELATSLRAEAEELRAAAGKNTPYNPKLKPVFEYKPPKRGSLGFEDSTAEFADDLIESAFKRPAVARAAQRLRGDECENGEQNEAPASIPFPAIEDDSSMDGNASLDEVTVPRRVLERIQSGSPKKRNDGTGCTRKLYATIDHRPRPPLKSVAKKQKAVPSVRISQFFSRLSKQPNPDLAHDAVIDLSD